MNIKVIKITGLSVSAVASLIGGIILLIKKNKLYLNSNILNHVFSVIKNLLSQFFEKPTYVPNIHNAMMGGLWF